MRNTLKLIIDAEGEVRCFKASGSPEEINEALAKAIKVINRAAKKGQIAYETMQHPEDVDEVRERRSVRRPVSA